ncbi:ABC transporter permease [Ramlibacter tataouinensis]|uniref:Candidate ABC type transport system, involved in lipoprotein release, permease component with duplicated domains n=1 Tax=Ramlibacter tataouinensis (strain ATCC BAA-407 / DSM 14655 / LMG 21543 / TTB310) TaxID=365046 RepID=F5Y3Q6_RAMTT|nr:ABC transporter permease [Ramlibacter tataouinensis]AEG93713.1 candidate ABC type transport system, involved in lipoprotein release, permease component with duplicated domains [Ramlibacter tataouinensis TTB310]
MLALLRTFSWQELRQHPWRSAAAAAAVMLGVALAFAVHLINASALSEFSSAVRSVNGQPDLELRAVQGGFDESLFARVAAHPRVELASPVLELVTLAATADGRRQPLRVLGVDALVVATLAPALLPAAAEGADRFALFAPDTLFLNPAARQLLGDGGIEVQTGLRLRTLRVAGTVSAGGAPLAVMDIAAAQDAFARQGQLTRIDLRLRPGTEHGAFIRSLQLPAGVTAAEPGDAAERVSNLSRAYRVNLTVLALVALFTGGFLVFSVLSLSVARRTQQLALLGVLGLTARQRLRLVVAESVALGAAGSLAGIALGTALAALALRLLGGDLGGGYFQGVAPTLQWSAPAATTYGVLGVVAAAAGGWFPARLAQALPLAQALKGLGGAGQAGRRPRGWSLALVALAGLLALLPPVAGIPLAAYLSVALLLVGGIAALPWAVGAVYDRLAPLLAHRVLPLLAVERARRVRESAAVAVSGVVASLSLAVALTVMVASFRDSVTRWLDVVLPADLYARTAEGTAAGEVANLGPGFVQAATQVPGVARVAPQRVRSLLLDPALPPVALLARRIDDPAQALPLVGAALPVPPGRIGIYVSEAVVDLYGARPGEPFPRLAQAFGATASGPPASFFVAGVWRDYARQSGAVLMQLADYQRLSGDLRANDLMLWLSPEARPEAVQQALRALAEREGGAGGLVEFASASEIRATSLRIFDRSFAVTYWLQAVAIAIGLFGVAASFSAQVLARRKEFGLLQHLGLTRRQVLAVVAGEGAAWTAIGSAAGLALGLAVAVVLVHVVNPQSFHWTMDLQVPWARLALLCAAVVAAGTLTAWLSGRAAAGRDAVLAVKEDW